LFDNLSTKDVLIKVLPYTTIPKDDNTILGETQSIVVSIVFTCHPQPTLVLGIWMLVIQVVWILLVMIFTT
jgi:hypothetical protein